jgi:hypothetical protein
MWLLYASKTPGHVLIFDTMQFNKESEYESGQHNELLPTLLGCYNTRRGFGGCIRRQERKSGLVVDKRYRPKFTQHALSSLIIETDFIVHTLDRYGAQTSQGIFNKLATHTDLSSLRQSYLTFGPGSSAFARVGYTTHYSSLPSSLQAQIDSKKETAAKTKSDRVFPLQVALGVGGAWVALWSDKSYSWNLGSQFDDLHDILNTAEEDGDKPASVALSPYKEGDYFIVRRNGFIAYSVSNLNDEASEYLSNMTNAYMQVRAQKDRITYQGMRTVGSVTKSYTIGPETKYPIDVSEMSKKKYMAGMLPQSLMQSFLNPNRTGSWGRFQLPDMQRRDVISMATAGICTATACDYAGLPRRVTVSATVGAVTGASACCWFLRKFSNDE